MEDVVLLDGARTPFGTYGGQLKDVTATDLAAIAGREALRRAGVDPALVDHVIVGNVAQTSRDAVYLARHAGLKAGVAVETPALTLNRLCGSGLQAIVSAAQSIALGESRFVLAGGAENMSMAPHLVFGARWGLGLSDATLEDSLWMMLTDRYCNLGMAHTAENLAERYAISREEQDRYAYRSQMAAKHAQESGWLREEVVPVEVRDRRGAVQVERDEHPRPDATLEQLGKLKPRFKEGGTVTPGNASGINDGAAMAVVTSAKLAGEHGLKPLGRLVSYAAVGVDPAVMGIGPAPAIRKALARADMRLDQMDLVEVNEAFAAQYLAVEKELGLDRDKVNVNGGAIALGHPVGASGGRVTLALLYEMRRRGLHYGIASLCIGGGQGIAAVWECLQ